MEVKNVISGNCYFCLAKTDAVWCSGCEKDFFCGISRCTKCGRECTHSLCGQCIKHPPHFNKTQVLFNYQYPVNQIIKTFKFKNHPEFARILSGKLAIKLLNNHAALPDVVVPVPLHKKRQRQRGYNQSLELAKQLRKIIGIKIENELCQKIRNTDPQSMLPIKHRRKNIKGAFVLNNTPVPKHIAIVDDVITTGSTINELAGLFKKAGCETIEAWAIARA